MHNYIFKFSPNLFFTILFSSVCHPNGSEYQCICEDQYFWSFNNCIVHHACNDLYEGVCTCIDVFPSDGQMCVTTSGKRKIVYKYINHKINT